MKATMDIPEDLYRLVKAKSAMLGRPVREVAVALFEGWIAEPEKAATAKPVAAAGRSLPAWFGAARRYARRVEHHDMTSIRRSIVAGRAPEGGRNRRER